MLFKSDIAFISNYTRSLLIFRADLIKQLYKKGFSIYTIAPDPGYEKEIRKIGASFIKFPLKKTSLNLFHEIISIIFLYKILKKIRPKKIFAYTIKPIIYGTLAAMFLKIREVYIMITGISYIFYSNNISTKILGFIIKPFLKISLKKARVIFFQNEDDYKKFMKLNIVSRKSNCMIVNGSGVDIDYYSYSPAPVEPISFIMIARLIKDKGIYEYIKAAYYIKLYYKNIKFKLIGPLDKHPRSIKESELNEWIENNIIEYYGEVKDIRPYVNNSSVFVLPSYHEGTSRAILEAMSIGRAIITTNAPGCKQTVKDGFNGFIVPVRNYFELAKAMEVFINNPKMIIEYGYNSRRLAEEIYDVKIINRLILKAMNFE